MCGHDREWTFSKEKGHKQLRCPKTGVTPSSFFDDEGKKAMKWKRWRPQVFVCSLPSLLCRFCAFSSFHIEPRRIFPDPDWVSFAPAGCILSCHWNHVRHNPSFAKGMLKQWKVLGNILGPGPGASSGCVSAEITRVFVVCLVPNFFFLSRSSFDSELAPQVFLGGCLVTCFVLMYLSLVWSIGIVISVSLQACLPSYSKIPGRHLFCLPAVFWAGELSRKFVFQICLPAEFCLPGMSWNVQICLPDLSFTTLLQSCQRENYKKEREQQKHLCVYIYIYIYIHICAEKGTVSDKKHNEREWQWDRMLQRQRKRERERQSEREEDGMLERERERNIWRWWWKVTEKDCVW